jgi:hypothetical protein
MGNMKFRTIGERLNYEREKEVWENNTYECDVESYGLYEDLSYAELIEE